MTHGIVTEDVREAFAARFDPALPYSLIRSAMKIEWQVAAEPGLAAFTGLTCGDLRPAYHGDGSLWFLWDASEDRIFRAIGEAPEQEPDRSICYFIGADDGPVKIGFSNNPEGRLRTLQTGHPLPLRILATVPCGERMEAIYHREFADVRLAGEWFSRTPELEAEIARLQGEAA